ncbi:MAG: hypothetical protein ISS94_00305 [Candidatus Syntrophoarchaeum sp.]|nr:hypothetical protein [Candidatus Syntrophoarchaeum sp.]
MSNKDIGKIKSPFPLDSLQIKGGGMISEDGEVCRSGYIRTRFGYKLLDEIPY